MSLAVRDPALRTIFLVEFTPEPAPPAQIPRMSRSPAVVTPMTT